MNPLGDGSVYSFCSFTPSSVLLVLLFLAALHAHNILMYYDDFPLLCPPYRRISRSYFRVQNARYVFLIPIDPY